MWVYKTQTSDLLNAPPSLHVLEQIHIFLFSMRVRSNRKCPFFIVCSIKDINLKKSCRVMLLCVRIDCSIDMTYILLII